MLGVQPRLLVDVPAGTQSVVELTGQSTNASLSQRSLSNLLGVQIDATWTLDRLAFSGLVDSIGGIYLDVKTPVVFRGPSGKVLFTLPKGIAKLDGPMAATCRCACWSLTAWGSWDWARPHGHRWKGRASCISPEVMRHEWATPSHW